jgi:hypothetical protein
LWQLRGERQENWRGEKILARLPPVAAQPGQDFFSRQEGLRPQNAGID